MKAVFKPLSGPKSHFDDRVKMGSRKDVSEISPLQPWKIFMDTPKKCEE